MPNHHGYSHINLGTLDLDATREFYEGVLGFPVVAAGIYEVAEGGHFRHVYFDVGNERLLSFLEPNNIAEIPGRFETDINAAIGVPPVFYHVAFEAGSLEELTAKREELLEKDVPVTEIVDHDWSHSIYFDDPGNRLKLEYCCMTRELRDEDAELAVLIEIPIAAVMGMMTP